MDSLSLKALKNIPEINPGTDLVDLIIQNILTEEVKIKSGDISLLLKKLYLNLRIDIKNFLRLKHLHAQSCLQQK